MMFAKLKDSWRGVKHRFQDVSLESLLWILNMVPRFLGFSFRKHKHSVLFWVVHLSLVTYIYGVGNLVYQWKYAESIGDYIKSFLNVALLMFIGNNSWFFISKRDLLNEILENIALSDELSRQTDAAKAKYTELMRTIKRVVIAFYFCNYLDELVIYMPHRANVMNDYSMIPCVGIEPLTTTPNRQLCTVMLGYLELSISVVVLNYQALLLFLIAHTAAMYRVLSYEFMLFNEFENLEEHQANVRKVLPTFVDRHSLILAVIDKLKYLYSASLGVNFASHAGSLLLVLYLPTEELMMFVPVVVYCFSVFFLYCFLCQKLVNASEDFEAAVYCCGWENFSLKEQKMIYVMLCQAQQPLEILAADIMPVNIYTFATTIQAMYKFVTVVKF